ncbi:hypothetical protein L484_001624 [Morus notabilis]|uniref:YqgF/RNase H-like domain-containing protein n=1 Tax=Morus notabilis TaxID=981085 RepID=W9SHJ7_9ROSA|nr:hypothetical protein L484_001624 [Morus notabilis]
MWSLQQQLASSPPSLQTPFLCAGRNPKSAPFSLQLFREQPRNYKAYHHGVLRAALVDEIPPNAFRRKLDPNWRGGFSLGVDLGMSRTGLALSKGFSVRPLSVLKLRGEKLEVQLLEIAQKQMVLERYFSMSGEGTELVLPKNVDLQERLRRGPARDIDFFPEE